MVARGNWVRSSSDLKFSEWDGDYLEVIWKLAGALVISQLLSDAGLTLEEPPSLGKPLHSLWPDVRPPAVDQCSCT